MNDTMYNVILVALLAVSILQLLRRGGSRRRPPGPPTLPVIGSAHHVVNTLVHRRLRDLAAAHGPIMMLRIGPMPLVVVTSRELAREVLKVQDPNFANRPRLLVGGICGYGWADIIFPPNHRLLAPDPQALHPRGAQPQADPLLPEHPRGGGAAPGGGHTKYGTFDQSRLEILFNPGFLIETTNPE
ncbi:premnaspirodiene oxygenase-like [Panicum miliaceum]|uniref:Premnaspirodiene oxygenase-like n=1 Tax=Panicum miliaceum TaxID=4540 RepID=A0A3L6TQ90_PANMI|nr:premnaspirodiene oxygenase-like [Panicum miliaceum]